MKKQLLLLVTMLLPMMAMAYDIAVENADGVTIYYNYINNGAELEVTDGNTPYSGEVNIPETVTFMNRTRKVTSIKSFTFYYSRKISSVIIPCSVTFIGQSAFENCDALTSVHISDVAAWCQIKFENYTSNPLYYANHLFLNGEEIKDLVIPNGVTYISADAFNRCIWLTSVIIPYGVTEIGERAFQECRNVTSFSIPSSVKTIGKYAFNFLERLTAVHISDISAWCEIDFVGYWYWSNPLYYAHHLFVNGVEIKNLVIPEGVTSICNFAFGGCTGLTSVTIPKSVTTIGGNAFYGCDLPEVISKIENPFKIETDIFSDNTFYNATLFVPVGTIDIYKATEGWKKFVFIEEGDGNNPPTPEKCATPTIKYIGGKLLFECETEDVEFVYSITTPANTTNQTGNNVDMPHTNTVSVYAKKAGYLNSDVATEDIDVRGLKGDVNSDGEVNVGDIVTTTNIMAGKDE